MKSKLLVLFLSYFCAAQILAEEGSGCFECEDETDFAAEALRDFYREYANTLLYPEEDGPSVGEFEQMYLSTNFYEIKNRETQTPICINDNQKPDFLNLEEIKIVPLVKNKVYNLCVPTFDDSAEIFDLICGRYSLTKDIEQNDYIVDDLDCYKLHGNKEQDLVEDYEPQPNYYGGKIADDYSSKELIEYISGTYVYENDSCKLSLEIDKQGIYQFKENDNALNEKLGKLKYFIGENYAAEIYLQFGEMPGSYAPDDAGLKLPTIWLDYYDKYFPNCKNDKDKNSIALQKVIE